MTLRKNALKTENNVGKGEYAVNQNFLLFPHVFYVSKLKFHFFIQILLSVKGSVIFKGIWYPYNFLNTM